VWCVLGGCVCVRFLVLFVSVEDRRERLFDLVQVTGWVLEYEVVL